MVPTCYFGHAFHTAAAVHIAVVHFILLWSIFHIVVHLHRFFFSLCFTLFHQPLTGDRIICIHLNDPLFSSISYLGASYLSLRAQMDHACADAIINSLLALDK